MGDYRDGDGGYRDDGDGDYRDDGDDSERRNEAAPCARSTIAGTEALFSL